MLRDEISCAASSQFYMFVAQVKEQPPVMITFLAWSMSEVCTLSKTASCCLVLLFMHAFAMHLLDALSDVLGTFQIVICFDILNNHDILFHLIS